MVSQEQVERFAYLFQGHANARGSYDESGPKKRVVTLPEGPTIELFRAHLEGRGPYLGVIPIQADNTCRFGAIDIDDDGVDLHELAHKIAAAKLPLLTCRSKSGGAHLYCFLAKPVAAGVLIDALKKFRQVLGHEKNHNGTPVEIFPKQVKLAAQQLGNWINLPYYNHEETNRYGVRFGYADALPLAAFLDTAEGLQTDERGLHAWADASLGPFAEGPPCLQQLHIDGFPEGGRNTALFNAGIFFKAQSAGSWEAELREYNESLPAPVEESEIRQIIRNLENHTYVYTCKQSPLEGVCKRRACKQQKYGIQFFIDQKKLEDLPEIEKLVKVKTDPPRYRVTINDKEIQLSWEEIWEYRRLREVAFTKLNLILPSRIKDNDWETLLKNLFDTLVEEDAPPEAGDRGLLMLLFDDFLIQRNRTEQAEDILRGYPWADPNDRRVYFRAGDLMVFLQRRQFRKYDINEIYTLLTELAGLSFSERTLKGVIAKLWSVPEPTNEQTQEFTPRDRGAKTPF